ncbi:MAG: carboxypeptidase-like regulatory domain-containing protein [Cytophagia bacterium]|nr:carboxypeptidase-like regulatory domain-containing protein [Cytophagia bacterium]
MRGFFIIFCCVCINLVQAQNITLSGRVVDKTSQEPLAFASIGIKGKSLGVISNLQGEFDFYIPNEFRNEILVISMLGYKSYEAPIWSITGSPSVNIEMERSTTYLQELIVQDSLKGGDILRIALSRADDNLPQKPFLMDGFYRDIKRVGGTYISLMEAAVQIYDEDSKEPRNKHKLKERVKLVEMRQSLGYESKFTTFFDQDNLLEDLLLNNNIRYRQIEAREELFEVMNREKDSYYNGHEIFVIAYTGEYTFRIFIDKEDYAIIRFEYKSSNESKEVVGKRKELEGRFAGTDHQ